MAIQSRTDKIIFFIVVNIIVIILLYHIPINNNLVIENICVYKFLFGKECWNCGMTRAFLSILHGDFLEAWKYNYKVIVVFPLTICMYLYSWYKFIFKNKKTLTNN